MAIKLGNEFLAWVETATPGTYVVIAGQGNFSHSRSRGAIATATKQSNWDTERAGMAKGKASLDIQPDLPDAGYARLETLAKAEPQVPFNIQVRKNGTSANGTTDVILAVSVTVDDLTEDKNQNDTVKSKFSFLYAAAPTVDTLA